MGRLANSTVLVTRPLPQAADLIQAIHDEGGHPIHVPTMAITPYEDEASEMGRRIKYTVMEVDRFDIAICISVTSATCILSWLDKFWPQMPVGIHWLAVGSATAKVLQSAGFNVSYPKQVMDSGELLKLPELQDVNNKKIVLFKGRGGRDALQIELRARGALVEISELYHRSAATDNAERLRHLLQQKCITAVTGHSSEMIENFFDLLGKKSDALSKLLNLPLIIPGERVAAKAKKLGFTQVVIAKNATTGPMLEALIASAH